MGRVLRGAAASALLWAAGFGCQTNATNDAGADLAGVATDDGGGDPGADLGTPQGDLLPSGDDLSSNSDGPTSPDLATVDLVTPPPILALYWSLLTANIQGGTNNGFVVTCDDSSLSSAIKTVTFTVQNGAGQKTTTTVPCPAGQSTGNIDLKLPDPTGPFLVYGVADGQASSVSEHLHNISPNSDISIRIYVFGCDAPSCM